MSAEPPAPTAPARCKARTSARRAVGATCPPRSVRKQCNRSARNSLRTTATLSNNTSANWRPRKKRNRIKWALVPRSEFNHWHRCEGDSLLGGLLLFVAGLAVAAPDVQISTLDGEPITGKVQQITTDQIVVKT